MRRRRRRREGRVIGDCVARVVPAMVGAVGVCGRCGEVWAWYVMERTGEVCLLCGGRCEREEKAPWGRQVSIVGVLGRDGAVLTGQVLAFDVCEWCWMDGAVREPVESANGDLLCVCAECRTELAEGGYEPVCVSAAAESLVPQSLDSPTR